jgi:hypothetical protein
MAPPFDFTSVDFSSHLPDLPEFAADISPSDLDEILQSMTGTGSSRTLAVSPTILNEFGLGEGWQPVMDGLGL